MITCIHLSPAIFGHMIWPNTSIPEDWDLSSISPVYRKENRSDPDNYHPISFLSIISKLYACHLLEKPLDWLHIYNIIFELQSCKRTPWIIESSPCQWGTVKDQSSNLRLLILEEEQAGFRTWWSTIVQGFILQHLVNKCLT